MVKPYGDYNSSADMVEALIDYYLGLSYRVASSKYSFSFTSLYRYWHSLSKASSRLKVKLVAIDEIGLVNRRMSIWYVIDLSSKRVVEVYVSLDSRTSIDVLRIIGKLGFNVEYVHDEGPWYNSLEWVKAKHEHETFGNRNTVEQAFRSLKHRLKRFHSFKHGSTKRATINWIKSYTTIPNIINTITRR